MDSPKMYSYEIKHNSINYKNLNGLWFVWYIGSYIDTPNKGIYGRWMPIINNKVPEEVKSYRKIK